MRGFKKLPQYFSIVALVISILVSAAKRISPVTALHRIVPAVVSFYILGFCISAVLAGEMKSPVENEKDTTPDSLDHEEFEDLKFPVIKTAEQDQEGRE
ncbi:MAG: hypothetical protein WCS98_00260 [Bacillota bacterium]|nr:hypothetical protein [Bacillota bacterium]MDD3297315.1 hypothetical protein [Bacillota bacterium]MDD3850108.1 hypothetical protein [Bacillota bacterium]MDD4706831.1 hypothetical protein [Bacillota bacterium]